MKKTPSNIFTVNQVSTPVISNIVRSIPTVVSFNIAPSTGQQSNVVYEISYYPNDGASTNEVRYTMRIKTLN